MPPTLDPESATSLLPSESPFVPHAVESPLIVYPHGARLLVEGQAWARLLAEKHDPEVGAVIGDAVKERSDASGRLKAELLEATVRTVVAGARSGSLVRARGRRASASISDRR